MFLEAVRTSGAITSDAVVCGAPAYLCSITVTAPAGNATSIILYDNASAASGTVLATINVLAGSTVTMPYAYPIQCLNGIYADVTGTGVTANVGFARVN